MAKDNDGTQKIELGNGYYATELTTTDAIDAAKHRMQEYQLAERTPSIHRKKPLVNRSPENHYGYYAVCDADGVTHATLVLSYHKQQGESLDYCMAQLKNFPPAADLMPYIKTFVKERKCRINNTISHTGLILAKGESGEEKLYDIYDFPEQNEKLTLVGYHRNGTEVFNFKNTGISKLPENLTVPGSLELDEMPIANLKGLNVFHTLWMGKTKVTEGENISVSTQPEAQTPLIQKPKVQDWASTVSGWFSGGKQSGRG